MAQLRNIFIKGIEVLFNVFNDAVKIGIFTQVIDNGFDDAIYIKDDIRCIFAKFMAKDVELLSFSKLIQPQDIKGLMPEGDLINCTMNTQTYIMFGTDKYSVEGYELDPIGVVYTLLLRKV